MKHQAQEAVCACIYRNILIISYERTCQYSFRIYLNQYFVRSQNNTTKIVGNLYRPSPSPKASLDILTETLYTLGALNNQKHDVFLMGDYNIELLHIQHHARTNEYIEDIFSHGYIPLILNLRVYLISLPH